MRGALMLSLRQALVSVATVGGVVALAILLPPREFALYGYVTTVMIVAAAVGDLGLGAALIRGEPTDRHLRGSLALQLLFWVPACAVGAAIGVAVGAYGFDDATIALLFAALLLLSLQALPTALLERRMAFGQITLVEVVQRMTFVGVAIALAASTPAQWSIPVAALAAALVGYPLVLVLSRWRWPPRLERGEPLFRGFSSDWWQTRLASQLGYATYPLLGGILFSETEVGWMVLALAITSAPALLSPMVARAAFPALSRSSPAEQVVIFRRLFRSLLLVSLPLLAALFACAEPLILHVFGSEYTPAVPLVRLECGTTFLGLALAPALPLLFLAAPHRMIKRVMVSGTVAVWLLGIALAPLVDYRALSIAQLAVLAILVLWLGRQLHETRGFQILVDMAPGALAMAIATSLGLLAATQAGNLAGVLAIGAGVAAVQLALTIALRGGVDPRILLMRRDEEITP